MLELSLGNVWAWALQVAALAGAGVLLPSLLRMTSPRARLLHFRALLLVCLALPLLQPWVTRPAANVSAVAVAPADLPAAGGAENLSDAAGGAGPAAGHGGLARFSLRGWPVESVLAGVYLAGVAARLGWLGLGLISLARLRRSAVRLEPRPEAVDDAALLVGADAEFLVSPRVVRPVTFGLRRPVVLVPPGFSSFAPEQQTAVAAHELLHVARRDWMRTLADELLLSVLWFHPVLWWLIEQIRLSTEQLVDREVVRLVGARKPYLEALLKLAAAGPTPMLQPASLFLKHGHLAQRVALLVREVSMSRVRLVSSFVLVLAVLAAGGWAVVQAFPLTAAHDAALLPSVPVAVGLTQAPPPPPPPPPPLPPPAPQAKPTVGVSVPAPGALPAASGTFEAAVVAAKRLEDAGDFARAEKAYRDLTQVYPKDPKAFLNLAGYYNRRGDFDKTVAALTKRVQLEPSNPEGPYTLATYYWDKAYRDATLDTATKRDLIAKGLEQADRAIHLKPDYMEGLTYKNLLLRLQATTETDEATKQALIAEADKLRDQAIKIRDERNKWDAVPANAVRVGGGIAPPTKLKNVSPVYPPDALAAKVAGVVIIEAVIGEDGKVRAARVLRSVPMLDPAALEAVKQWEFTPTLLNGTAVPVVMTATVNFVPKEAAGVSGGVAGGVTGAFDVPPPPPPPPPGEGKGLFDPAAVRTGGGIKPPARISHVNPVYPPDARDARVQGVVILDVLIGVDGRVEQAKVLRSIPLLDQAAIDAVTQWVFTPTTVNGEPKKVIMTVTVNFTLQ